MSGRRKVIRTAFRGGKWNWSNEVRRNKLLLWMMSISAMPLWFAEFGVRDSRMTVCAPKMETFTSSSDAQPRTERKECNFDRREWKHSTFFLSSEFVRRYQFPSRNRFVCEHRRQFRAEANRREAKNDWNGTATRNLFLFSFLIKCYRSQTRIELLSATQPLDSACECSVHRIRTRRK